MAEEYEGHPTPPDAACPDPGEKFTSLRVWSAHDTAAAERRAAVLVEMTTVVDSTKGAQKTYETARKAQVDKLRGEIYPTLSSVRKNVECQLGKEYREHLTECFCEKQQQADASATPPKPTITCDEAKRCRSADLEKLRAALTGIDRYVAGVKARLAETSQLPTQAEGIVTKLGADAKELDGAICAKTIEPERAFVVQLELRARYVKLRRQLTDSRTFICTVYGLIDELFDQYELDVCVRAEIARLEKEAELEAARRAAAQETLVDEVLRCAKPDGDGGEKPDDDDIVDLEPPCVSTGAGGKTQAEDDHVHVGV